MKLIYLHQYFNFPDEKGGTRSYDLAKSFVQAGHKVIIVSATSDKKIANGNRWSVVVRDTLEVHYIYIPYGNHLSYRERIFAFFKFVFFSTFYILKIKCDLVLATSTPLTIGIPALLKKWIKKTPYIFEVRDVWPEAVIAVGAINNNLIKQSLFFLERLIYKNSISIVPLSIDMKKSIIKRVPEVASKIHHVIPNISEINRFRKNIQPLDLKEVLGFKPRFSVFYAGTFGLVNGLHKMVELAEITKKIDSTLCYILIGNGSLKEDIIQQAKTSGVLNKNFFVFNSIKKNDLPAWYAATSIGSSFVIDIKELWANSANKFFDTLAANRPILINHEGWQADVIRRKNIGYVLPAKISKEAAIEFVNYTKNINLQKTQSTNAGNLAEKYYSLDVAVEKYLDIFSKI